MTARSLSSSFFDVFYVAEPRYVASNCVQVCLELQLEGELDRAWTADLA